MADLLAQEFQDLKLELAEHQQVAQQQPQQYDGSAEAAAAAEAVVGTPKEGGVEAKPASGQTPEPADSDRESCEGKVFVGGISWQTSDESLSKYFSKFGALADVALMKDKYTGQPRGFGFIKFEDPSVVDLVLAQADHSIDGRTVDVKRAVPKSEAPGPVRASRPADTNKIFVGGLAPSVTAAEFRQYFEGFGTVSDAVVMFDRQTLRSRGFGFVTFQDDAVVQNVLMGTHEINGKMVEVKHAEPKESRRGAASPGAGRAIAYGALYGMPGGGRGVRGGGAGAYARGAGGVGATSPYGYGVYGASAAAAAAAYGTAYGAAAAAAYGGFPAYAAYAGGGYSGYSGATGAAGYPSQAYRGAGTGGYDTNAAAAGANSGASPYVSLPPGVNGYGLAGPPSAGDSQPTDYAGAFRGQGGGAGAAGGQGRAAEAYVTQQF